MIKRIERIVLASAQKERDRLLAWSEKNVQEALCSGCPHARGCHGLCYMAKAMVETMAANLAEFEAKWN